jgi:hypothetical protein
MILATVSPSISEIRGDSFTSEVEDGGTGEGSTVFSFVSPPVAASSADPPWVSSPSILPTAVSCKIGNV